MSEEVTIPLVVIRQGESQYYKFKLKNVITQYTNIFLLVKDEEGKVYRTFSLLESEGCVTGFLTIDETDIENKTLRFSLDREFTRSLPELTYLFEFKVKLIIDGEEDEFDTIFEERFFRISNAKSRKL